MTKSKVFNNMSMWNSGDHQTQLMEVFTAATFFKKNNLFIIIGGKLLYNNVVVFAYIDMNQPWVYMCPLPPLGCPSAPVLSALFHALNLDWSFLSHRQYKSFNAVLSNHPTLAFSQSPKVCSLYLCLFCCLTYRVVITIFLNSIYMCWYTILVFLFLTYITLH